MAEGINVRFTGVLQQFIQKQTGSGGIYSSASEYIRDLVRHDFQREQDRLDESLYQTLKAGAEAPLSEFAPLDVEAIITKGKKRRAAAKA